MAKKNIDLKKLASDFWYGKPHTAEEGGRSALNMRWNCLMVALVIAR